MESFGSLPADHPIRIKTVIQPFAFALFALAAPLAFTSCEPEGPAERAGKEIDEAAEELEDAVD